MTSTSPRRSGIIEDIEYKTGRRVLIDTVETDDVLAKCHAQNQSPLFTLLPRELRDLIWAFTTAPEEDQNNKYETTAYYYRPGHTAKLKSDYGVLLTCRRAWLEAHALPMLQAEHSFYYDRAAPDRRTKEWMAGLTSMNRKDFGTLRMYVQMCNIESLGKSCRLRDYFLKEQHEIEENFQPRVLHVTIRHTDWWYWESEQPLRLDMAWVQAILNSPDLRRTEIFKLELETLDYKVCQLEPIVESIKRLESPEIFTHIQDGDPAQPVKTRFVLIGDPEINTWSGPTNIDGKQFAPYKGKDKLNYHAVTLTWRLQFPDHPNVHIPHARLLPRCTKENGVPSSPSDEDLPHAHSRSVNREFGAGMSQENEPPGYPEPLYPQSLNLRRRVAHIRRRVMLLGTDEQNRKFRNYDDIEAFHSWSAEMVEWYRRKRFWEMMRPVWEDSWRQSFESKNSLLSLQ